MLQTTAIIERAMQTDGLEDFGGMECTESLDILVQAINLEAGLDLARERETEKLLVELLVNRLKIIDWRKCHPEISSAPVRAPWVVIGLPRTGSTLLSYLLNEDPCNRSLLNWEATSSVPPAAAGQLRTDPRVIEAQKKQQEFAKLYPYKKMFHSEEPAGPTECLLLFAQDFKSLLFEARLTIPSYGEWLDQCDHSSAYHFHKTALQVLQSYARGRWTLKAPQHSLAPDHLLDTYPDACLIQTHRDPLAVYRSIAGFMKLMSHTRPETFAYIEQRWLQVISLMITRLMAFREANRCRVIDVYYADAIRDPVAVAISIYAEAGELLPAVTATKMRSYLAGNPQHKHGRPDIRTDIDHIPDSVMDLFDTYRKRFDVPREVTL